jgi:hypothetical protein
MTFLRVHAVSMSRDDELVLCAATTIDKSRGSEYPFVAIPISTQRQFKLQRALAAHDFGLVAMPH